MLLPLCLGNSWTYRSRAGAPRVLVVGATLAAAGETWFRLDAEPALDGFPRWYRREGEELYEAKLVEEPCRLLIQYPQFRRDELGSRTPVLAPPPVDSWAAEELVAQLAEDEACGTLSVLQAGQVDHREVVLEDWTPENLVRLVPDYRATLEALGDIVRGQVEYSAARRAVSVPAGTFTADHFTETYFSDDHHQAPPASFWLAEGVGIVCFERGGERFELVEHRVSLDGPAASNAVLPAAEATAPSPSMEWRARIQGEAAGERARSEVASLRHQLKGITCVAALKAAPSLSLVAAPEPAFHFGWPAPGRASVVETTMKSGHVSRMRYTVNSSERSATDGSFELRLREFHLLELDGHDGTDPKFAMGVRRLEAAAATIPSLHIDASGRCVGLGDATALLEQLGSLGVDASIERLDAMRPLLAKFWFAWSHAWEGLALEPDSGFSSTPVHFCLHGGVAHRSEARTTRRRRDGLWNVTHRAESPPFSESPFREAIAAALDSGKRLKKSAELPDLRVTIELEALLDTEARLPLFVARGISASAANGTFEEREVQCWEFDWEP